MIGNYLLDEYWTFQAKSMKIKLNKINNSFLYTLPIHVGTKSKSADQEILESGITTTY